MKNVEKTLNRRFSESEWVKTARNVWLENIFKILFAVSQRAFR